MNRSRDNLGHKVTVDPAGTSNHGRGNFSSQFRPRIYRRGGDRTRIIAIAFDGATDGASQFAFVGGLDRLAPG